MDPGTETLTPEVVEEVFHETSLTAPGRSPMTIALAVVIMVVAGSLVVYGGYRGAKWLLRHRKERKEQKKAWEEAFGKRISDRDALLLGITEIRGLEAQVSQIASTPEERLAELGNLVARGDTEAQRYIAEAGRVYLPIVQAMGIQTSPNVSHQDAVQAAEAIERARNEKGQFVSK